MPAALAPTRAVGCHSLLGLFSVTVTHFELCASGPRASASGAFSYAVCLPGGLVLAIATHLHPLANGPGMSADGADPLDLAWEREPYILTHFHVFSGIFTSHLKAWKLKTCIFIYFQAKYSGLAAFESVQCLHTYFCIRSYGWGAGMMRIVAYDSIY